MQAQSFIGKISTEGLKLMDEHINGWLEKNDIVPKTINQVFGNERHHHHDMEEPVLVTTIWY